jgi:hypothetical protein
MSPAARAWRTAELDAPGPQAVHLVAVHARHIKPVGRASGVKHGVVARPLGAKTEIVAHQHIARAQAAHKHLVDEGLGRLGCQPRVKWQHYHCCTPQRLSSVSLSRSVPMRAGARSGLRCTPAK